MARPIQPLSPNRLVRLRGLSFCCRSGRCQLPQLAPILGGCRHHFTSAHPIRSILNELRGEVETNQSRTPGDTGSKLEVSEQAIHAAIHAFSIACSAHHANCHMGGYLLAPSLPACLSCLWSCLREAELCVLMCSQSSTPTATVLPSHKPCLHCLPFCLPDVLPLPPSAP